MDLKKDRGNEVIVYFWATWCPPCRAEIPDLVALQARYGDRLQVIGVSQDEAGVEVVKRFAEAQHMNYPIVMSTPEIEKAFPGVAALPTSFVVDPKGKIAYMDLAYSTRDSVSFGKLQGVLAKLQ